MRSKALGNQGRNDRGRFVTFSNPPKNQPQFHANTFKIHGHVFAINGNGIEAQLRQGLWMVVCADNTIVPAMLHAQREGG